MSSVRTTLSGSTQGTGIKVSSTDATAQGEIVHIHGDTYNDSKFDEIYLYAHNSHSSSVTLTLQWGGLTDPDNIIDISIAAGSFLGVVPGLSIGGSLTVSATASVTNKIVLYGYVLAHQLQAL